MCYESEKITAFCHGVAALVDLTLSDGIGQQQYSGREVARHVITMLGV